MKEYGALLVAATMLSAAPVLAQDTGWYVGAGLGASDVGLSEGFWLDSDRSSGEVSTVGVAAQIFIGHRFSPRFALEGGYVYLGETEFRGETDGFNSRWNAGAMKGRTRVGGIHLQGVARWPLGESRTALYAKGGLFFWDTETYYDSTINDINHFNDDGMNPIIGLGMDMRLWNEWRLRAEYQYSIVFFEQRTSVDVHIATLGVMHAIP